MINNYVNLKAKELVSMEKETAVVSEAKIGTDENGAEVLIPAVKKDVYKATVNVYSPDGEISPQTVSFDREAVEKVLERLNAELVLFNAKIADMTALLADIDAM